jgi:hypothetical protein
VFVTTNSTHTANLNLFNAMPFDPRTDFAPVVLAMPAELAAFAEAATKRWAQISRSQRSRK